MKISTNVSNICKVFVDIYKILYKSCQWILSQYHKDTSCPQINQQIQLNSNTIHHRISHTLVS